ncbi:MAG: hypothetical protein M3347_13670, partial [Armatimonadota bacterium]|nr:hypothetical protein [Armatimonadota bacterium]
FHVKQWSVRGKQLADWKFPDHLHPDSILYIYHNQPRAILWNKQLKRWVEVSFIGSSFADCAVIDLAVDPEQHDLALAPGQVKRIRQIMKDLNLYPSPRIGQHIGDFSILIDTFSINAPPFDSDRIAWNEDLSVLSFGRNMLTEVSLAFRQLNGKYRKRRVESILQTAFFESYPIPKSTTSLKPFPQLPLLHGLPPDSKPNHARSSRTHIPVELLSIVVSKRMAVYGAEVGTDKNLRRVVAWLDIKSPTPKVMRKKPGLLARVLQRL